MADTGATASSSSADSAAPAPVPREKQIHPLIRKYLVIYNTVSAIGWFTLTYLAIATYRDYETLFIRYGQWVAIVQSFAVLEIFHSLFKIVRSPFLTTTMQVFSRLFLVWGVCASFPFKTVVGHWAYITMVIAWGVTEIVRYLYYAMTLVDFRGDYYWFLVWCRYNLFYVLYPVGAGSEMLLIQRAIPIAERVHKPTAQFFRVMTMIYPIAFYFLYTHMMAQRRKFVESGVLEAKEREEQEKLAAAAARKDE
ncbi:Ptplb-like protein [Zopfochytrium polystomum]|nr:Ptplb-like protein [Zopfochytrium polystomum]